MRVEVCDETDETHRPDGSDGHDDDGVKEKKTKEARDVIGQHRHAFTLLAVQELQLQATNRTSRLAPIRPPETLPP